MDTGSDFDMLHLGAIWSDECFLDPCIQYLLIGEDDRESVHLRISLECLPIYLRIDESLYGILGSIGERVIELSEDTLGQYIESLRFEHISERLASRSSSFFSIDTVDRIRHFATHPLLSEIEPCLEFYIFLDEVVLFDHRRSISYISHEGKSNYPSATISSMSRCVISGQVVFS
jgi:hypothetical protein